MKKELRFYRKKDGNSPFIEWINELKDNTGKAHIANRLNRIALGNYGDCKVIGNGVKELRVHYGPGYRVYFVEYEHTVLVLLLGGNKKTQKRDIRLAQEYLADFRERCYD